MPAAKSRKSAKGGAAAKQAARQAKQLAIALHYEAGRDAAPRIVATGRGAVAEQILALAFANGVKVREDADLAQILAAVDVNSLIPVEVIATVAEILAYVYRANGREPPGVTTP